MRLQITAAARHDLSGIAAYTEAQWGREQRQRYIDLRRGQMTALRTHNDVGMKRDEVHPGCRSLASGRHQIFYRYTATAVVVLRVLHQSMDVRRHISSQAETGVQDPE